MSGTSSRKLLAVPWLLQSTQPLRVRAIGFVVRNNIADTTDWNWSNGLYGQPGVKIHNNTCYRSDVNADGKAICVSPNGADECYNNVMYAPNWTGGIRSSGSIRLPVTARASRTIWTTAADWQYHRATRSSPAVHQIPADFTPELAPNWSTQGGGFPGSSTTTSATAALELPMWVPSSEVHRRHVLGCRFPSFRSRLRLPGRSRLLLLAAADSGSRSAADSCSCPQPAPAPLPPTSSGGGDWVDTQAGNSMAEDDSLFQVVDLGGNEVFGTSSTQTNIHSHYITSAECWVVGLRVPRSNAHHGSKRGNRRHRS